MSISYVRPPTDAAGNKLSYEQRRAARRQAEAEKRAQQSKAPPARPDFYNQSYAERQRIRKAEEQGRQEAAVIAANQEAARKAADLAATPEHLRRPDNVWKRLIAEFQSQAFRPEIAKKIAEYQKRAEEEDRRIESIMAEKARRHSVETDPETVKAREHLASASQAAETEEERREWAKLSAMIDCGQAAEYWNQSAALTQARVTRLQVRLAEEAGKSAAQDAALQAAKAELDTAAQSADGAVKATEGAQ
jgi:hypothetical protein